MKMRLLVPGTFVFLIAILLTFSCTKTVTKTVTVTDTVTKTITDTVIAKDTVVRKDTVQLYSIQGLWVGTYTAAVNGGTPYFFSITVFPDGTLNYKSKGTGNTTFYAYGTWSLMGSAFTFSVVETSSSHLQQGSATYNSSTGTLNSGIISDSLAGTSATWSMSRVN
jgi:hypothetical protein